MSLHLQNIDHAVGGDPHITGVDLALEPGSFNVLLGRTLAGKTTLMRLMAGLEQPTRGRIYMDGKDVTGVSVRKRNVSMVYQQFINYPSLTVRDNIASPLKLARTPSQEIKRRVESIAEMLHIEHLLERYPQELSGGQQQRTAMGRALVKDADLILFDEPLVNLDYKLREELRDELRELFKARNCIAVYATTEPNEALALGGTTINLTEAMANEWADYTLPTLDLDDFIGLQYGTGPDGSVYQLPTQQFANLYWFRYDWFQREDLQEQFRDIYGYDLGVPTNWTAYEDIAEFFTVHVGEIDGTKVYGHMDYGRRDPSLGWRFHDSWLSMAGMGSPGVPFGNPVDDWGIRVNEESQPVGASVSRGGATNSPASVFAMQKAVDWLRDFAPAEAQGMTFGEAGPVPAQGHIAQQIFWYTAFTADMTDPSVAVTDDEGNPLWRMAPSPTGPYWEEGMKVGYQDVGAWTFFDSTPEDRRTAAWLFAQFTVAKTTSLEKLMHGLTPIRESDIFSDQMTEMAPKLGGLVEFYRSPNESNWTPTGTNVPDYPRMAPLWWQNLAPVMSGEVTPQEGLDKLAADMDNTMNRLARANVFDSYAPVLNEERDPQYWLDQDGAPKPKLDDEMPQGTTVPYDEMMEAWMAAGTR